MPNIIISRWKAACLNYENTRCLKMGVIYCLLRRKNIIKEIQQKALHRWAFNKNIKSTDSNNSLATLATNAILMQNSKKELIKYWKNFIFSNSFKKKNLINALICRTFKKLEKFCLCPCLQRWKKFSHENISKLKKVENMIKIFNLSLKKCSKAALFSSTPRAAILKKKSPLLRSNKKNTEKKINIKMFFFVLNSIYYNTLEECLKRIQTFSSFVRQSKVKSMIKVLLSIYSHKAKRCFRPIRVYKCVEEIKTRAVKKIMINCYRLIDLFKLKWNLWKHIKQESKFKCLFNSYRAVKMKASLSRMFNKTTSNCIYKIINGISLNKSSIFKIILEKIIRRRLIRSLSLLTAKISTNLLRFFYLCNRISTRTLRLSFNKLSRQLIKRVLSKMISSIITKQQFAIEKLKKRALLYRVIRKLNSVYILYKQALATSKKQLEKRFKA